VVELGSNDGYLLQHFRRRGVSIIGGGGRFAVPVPRATLIA
jgi:hypothetical protein